VDALASFQIIFLDMVWLNRNALILNNVVTLRQAWLTPGWWPSLGCVNHLGAEPCTQVDSSCAIRPWVGAMSTQW